MYYCVVVAGIVVGCSQCAFAYLDPGTGSFVLQILTAALIGAIYMLKLFWKNVTQFFSDVYRKVFKKG